MNSVQDQPSADDVAIFDAETRSEEDVRKTGAVHYMQNPTTEPLCIAWRRGDRRGLWLPGDPPADEIVTAPLLGAWNVGFEYSLCRYILAPRFGWPESLLSLPRWRDPQSMALKMGMPPALGLFARAAKLKNQKGPDTIMHQMCRPRPGSRPGDPPGLRFYDNLERRHALQAYCRQDVEVEWEAFWWLLPLGASEQEIWRLSEEINQDGFCTDKVLIEKALALTSATERDIQAEIKQLTSGEIQTTNQVKKLLPWLAARGCELPNVKKESIEAALQRSELVGDVRRVLELRREASHASATKFRALAAWRCADGRVRGTFRYHGAATGRWSGFGPQPQNFKREGEDLESTLSTFLDE
jgi:DNA polymerase